MKTDIETIEEWLAKHGVAESTLGMYAAKNHNAVSRIRAETASMATVKRVLAYCKDNPQGLPKRAKVGV